MSKGPLFLPICRALTATSKVVACRAALLVFVLTLSGSALAQATPDELARRHFESGAAYFEQAEYDSALREFQEAYALSSRPEILINIATVDERLSDLKGAVSALDEYLKLRPDSDGSDSLRMRRDNLQKRLDAQAPAPKPDATPPPAPQSKPAPPATAGENGAGENGPNRVPSYVLFSVAGVSVAGALLTGGFAQAEYNDLKKQCAPNCANSETANAKTLSAFSTVLTGAAIASAAVGAVLWFTIGSDHSHASADLSASVEFTAHGPMARARVTF